MIKGKTENCMRTNRFTVWGLQFWIGLNELAKLIKKALEYVEKSK